MTGLQSSGTCGNVRAADAKEVGVGNPAEETYCHPNGLNISPEWRLSTGYCQTGYYLAVG
jgi:hypothetical protein